MLNSVNIIGRVVNTPSIRETLSGIKCLPFIIVQKYNGKQVRIRCAAFEDIADRLVDIIKKHTVLVIQGHIENMHFYDKEDKLVCDPTIVVDKYIVVTGRLLSDGSIGIFLGEVNNKRRKFEEIWK